MKTKKLCTTLVLLALVATTSSCVIDDDDDVDDEIDTSYKIGLNGLTYNKIGLNKIGLNGIVYNKIGLNSLATTNMMATAGSREVYSYVVSCALPAGTSVIAKDANGVSYSFAGALGLAPAWATRAPTVSERRWVSACLLSRTNLYGISVQISLRHDTNVSLTTTASERTQFSNTEGAFYGDVFATPQTWFACGGRSWTPYATNSLRMCALSSNGSTTDCGFTYTGACTAACTDKTTPFGACLGGATRYSEVITVHLTPTQQQGQTQ